MLLKHHTQLADRKEVAFRRLFEVLRILNVHAFVANVRSIYDSKPLDIEVPLSLLLKAAKL